MFYFISFSRHKNNNSSGSSNYIDGINYQNNYQSLVFIFLCLKSALRNLWLGENIKDAIDYKRVHHQLSPPQAQIEKHFPNVIS